MSLNVRDTLSHERGLGEGCNNIQKGITGGGFHLIPVWKVYIFPRGIYDIVQHLSLMTGADICKKDFLQPSQVIFMINFHCGVWVYKVKALFSQIWSVTLHKHSKLYYLLITIDFS